MADISAYLAKKISQFKSGLGSVASGFQKATPPPQVVIPRAQFTPRVQQAYKQAQPYIQQAAAANVNRFPVAQVKGSAIPKFTLSTTTPSNLKGPVKLGHQAIMGLAGGALNTIPGIVAGAVQFTKGAGQVGTAAGQRQFKGLNAPLEPGFQNVLTGAGRVGTGALNLLSLGQGAPAVSAMKGLSKQTLKSAVGRGVAQGLKFGTPYGALQGAMADPNTRMQDQITNIGKGTYEGAIGGAIGGAAAGAAGYGLSKLAVPLGKQLIHIRRNNRYAGSKVVPFNSTEAVQYRKRLGQQQGFINPGEILDSFKKLFGRKPNKKELSRIAQAAGSQSSKQGRQIAPQTGQLPLRPGQQSPGLKAPGGKSTQSIVPTFESSLPSSILPNGKVVKERGFVTSVKYAPSVSDPTRGSVAGSYQVKTNQKLMGEAKALLTEGASIDFKNTKNLDQKVAATIHEAITLDRAGKHEAAAHLFNNLSEHATELGRGVQAFSLLDNMSPEAVALSAAGKIKRYNRTAVRKIPELTGEQQKMISDAVGVIKRLPDGREKNIAINELSNRINDFIPSSITDKAIAVWKAGLLTSLRTHERNLLGNTLMGGFEALKDIPATAADTAMRFVTGKRTLTPTLRGTVELGSKATRQQVSDVLQKGYDPSSEITKYEMRRINWGNNKVEQALKKYTDAVFNTLGAEDKPFFNAAFARSIYDQAGAQAINAGKAGNREFIESLAKSPTQDMLTTATADANYATFRDPNKLSSLARTIKHWASQNWWTKLPAEVLAPFTGVPSSIAGKTVVYSPIGLIKGAIKAGRVVTGQVPELQRQAAQEIGRGVIGTGLYGLGAYLMSKGLMTGQPKDATEARQWQLENKPSNSLMVGGKWRSINSVGPQTLVLLAGAKLQEEMSNPEGSFGNYAFGLGKDQLSQTFLAGVQGPLNAITDPARYGQSYVGNQLASTVPNIVKDTAKATDPYVRENNRITDYFKQGIPGVRKNLLPKRDALGNIIPQEPTGVKAYYDLFNSKTPVTNIIVDELARLNNVGFNATPADVRKNQTINKQKVVFTPEELNEFKGKIGELLQPLLAELIQTPEYQALSDEDKAKTIDKLVQAVRTEYKKSGNLPETNKPKLTKEKKPKAPKKPSTGRKKGRAPKKVSLRKSKGLKKISFKSPTFKQSLTRRSIKLPSVQSNRFKPLKTKKFTAKDYKKLLLKKVV